MPHGGQELSQVSALLQLLTHLENFERRKPLEKIQGTEILRTLAEEYGGRGENIPPEQQRAVKEAFGIDLSGLSSFRTRGYGERRHRGLAAVGNALEQHQRNVTENFPELINSLIANKPESAAALRGILPLLTQHSVKSTSDYIDYLANQEFPELKDDPEFKSAIDFARSRLKLGAVVPERIK